jgi:hypothetical protein
MELPESVAVTVAGNLRSRRSCGGSEMTSDPAGDSTPRPAGSGLGRPSHQGPEGISGNTDLERHRVNISRSLGATHSESAEAPPGGTNEDRGSVTRRDARDRTQLTVSRRVAGEEKIMTAIKTASITPRQRASRQNGLPERVPYVYGQQTRRNAYAARIARRNVEGWWQPPAALPSPKLTRPQAPAGTAA